MWFFRKNVPPHALYVWFTAGVVLVLKALFILFSSIRGLSSTTWIIDDSLIEMKVAMNLGQGHGFSLDGLHATTGAPFLWIYLTSINHMFFAKDAAIRATFIESSLLGALATVVVFYIALKLTQDRRIAWTAFLLSTFSANAFFEAMNGMDTALFTLLVLLGISTYLGIGKPAKWSAFAWGCVIGLVLGLTVMTRGDGLFLIASIGCVELYEWWKASKHDRKKHLHTLAGIAVVAGICFAIFMAWQLIQTGSPFPANQVGRRQLSLDFHNFSFDHFVLSAYLNIVAWNVFQLEDLVTIATGGALLVLAAFVFGLFDPKLRKLSMISVIYIGVFFTLLVGYQWYFADLHGLRYINPAVHIFFIYVAYLLWQLPIARGKKTAIILIATCFVISGNYKHYQMCSRFRWAPAMSYIARPNLVKNTAYWATIDWMNANLPAGTIVGVRDYGRVSLFTKVRVQDLAGNIDVESAKTLKNGTMDQFLKDRKVEYLLIPPADNRQDKLYQYLRSHLHLEQVADAPTTPDEALFKIIW